MRLVTVVGAGVLSCAVAWRTAAADWTYLDVTPGRADFEPRNLVVDGDGFALIGGGFGHDAIARFASDGTLKSARYVYPPLLDDFGPYGLFDAAAAPGGGTFALYLDVNAFGDPVCSAARLQTDAQIRWSHSNLGFYDCVVLGTDAAGGFWLRGGTSVQHVAADGTAGASATLHVGYAANGADIVGAVDAASGTLYAVAPGHPGENAQLLALGVDGSSRVLWQDSGTEALPMSVAFGSDGNVYAAGTDKDGPFAFSFTPSGTQRWLRRLSGTRDVLFTAATTDGTLFVLTDHTLSVINNDGTLRWQQTVSEDSCDTVFGCDDYRRELAVAPNGDVLLASLYVPELLRFDAQGHELARTRLQASAGLGTRLAALADGSALLGPLYAPGAHSDGVVARVLRDGSRQDPNLKGILPQQEQVYASAQDTSGAVYVLSLSSTSNKLQDAPNRSWLSKVAPDGTLLWKQGFDGSVYYATLQVSADRACYTLYDGTNSHVQCRAAADGAPLWDRSTNGVFAFRLLADDTTIVLSGDDIAESHLSVVRADGTLQRDLELPYVFRTSIDRFAIAANGTTIVSSLSLHNAVFAWDRNGDGVFSAVAPLAGSIDGPVETDSDGSAVLVPEREKPYAWRLSADGKTQWTHALDFEAKIAAIDHGTVYAIDYADYPNGAQLHRFDAASGAERLVPLAAPPPAYVLPGYDRASGLLLTDTLNTASVGGVTLYDPTDGHLVRALVQDCGGGPCAYRHFAARFDANGTLRVVSEQPGNAAGAGFRIDAIAHAAAPPPGVRVDQAGIDGAWYAPYEAGQGFSIDFIPSGPSGVLFMPWFTYGIDAADAPYDLHWYTLQGDVASDARSVDLAIARTAPGTFNAGAVATQRVGSASLRFSDCNNALLVYQFDPNATGTFGQGGTIALARLSPSTAPCRLADGGSGAAQLANAPAQGFDARQSGTWYDPATAGQGLQLSVIPAGNGFAGLLFGAWFTFDPAGQADDAQQQHWFTLQGDLSAASNGRVELPILRTLGGRLDGTATRNTVQVGHATLTFAACDRATLEFAFDRSDVAHAFAGLAGSTALVKIGGCGAP